ncbi:MAG: DUF5606 domain-containing protein [Cyclobacteriaceae bacterium]
MIEFKEIATISGKGGLYKVVNPTRTGVILESLDDKKKKLIVNGHTKVSILAEISVYTTDEDGVVPLEEVFQKIHAEFDGDTGLSSSSDPEELRAFLKFVLPTFDAERVYVSDIKKMVSWYGILVREAPELLTAKEEATAAEAEKSE